MIRLRASLSRGPDSWRTYKTFLETRIRPVYGSRVGLSRWWHCLNKFGTSQHTHELHVELNRKMSLSPFGCSNWHDNVSCYTPWRSAQRDFFEWWGGPVGTSKARHNKFDTKSVSDDLESRSMIIALTPYTCHQTPGLSDLLPQHDWTRWLAVREKDWLYRETRKWDKKFQRQRDILVQTTTSQRNISNMTTSSPYNPDEVVFTRLQPDELTLHFKRKPKKSENIVSQTENQITFRKLIVL